MHIKTAISTSCKAIFLLSLAFFLAGVPQVMAQRTGVDQNVEREKPKKKKNKTKTNTRKAKRQLRKDQKRLKKRSDIAQARTEAAKFTLRRGVDRGSNKHHKIKPRSRREADYSGDIVINRKSSGFLPAQPPAATDFQGRSRRAPGSLKDFKYQGTASMGKITLSQPSQKFVRQQRKKIANYSGNIVVNRNTGGFLPTGSPGDFSRRGRRSPVELGPRRPGPGPGSLFSGARFSFQPRSNGALSGGPPSVSPGGYYGPGPNSKHRGNFFLFDLLPGAGTGDGANYQGGKNAFKIRKNSRAGGIGGLIPGGNYGPGKGSYYRGSKYQFSPRSSGSRSGGIAGVAPGGNYGPGPNSDHRGNFFLFDLLPGAGTGDGTDYRGSKYQFQPRGEGSRSGGAPGVVPGGNYAQGPEPRHRGNFFLFDLMPGAGTGDGTNYQGSRNRFESRSSGSRSGGIPRVVPGGNYGQGPEPRHRGNFFLFDLMPGRGEDGANFAGNMPEFQPRNEGSRSAGVLGVVPGGDYGQGPEPLYRGSRAKFPMGIQGPRGRSMPQVGLAGDYAPGPNSKYSGDLKLSRGKKRIQQGEEPLFKGRFFIWELAPGYGSDEQYYFSGNFKIRSEKKQERFLSRTSNEAFAHQGNYKMKRNFGKNMHPSTEYIGTRGPESENRGLVKKVKVWVGNLIGNTDQPSVVTEKPKKPRYDPKNEPEWNY